MNARRHSPGPFRAVGPNGDIFSSDGTAVCRVYIDTNQHGRPSGTEWKENRAYLVACENAHGPMRDALEMARDFYQDQEELGLDVSADLRRIESALALAAKAQS